MPCLSTSCDGSRLGFGGSTVRWGWPLWSIAGVGRDVSTAELFAYLRFLVPSRCFYGSSFKYLYSVAFCVFMKLFSYAFIVDVDFVFESYRLLPSLSDSGWQASIVRNAALRFCLLQVV